MSNKNLISDKTTIFRNKLSKILERLQSEKDKVPQQTREAIVSEAVRLLSIFYKTIGGSTFKPEAVIAGTAPDWEVYNSNFTNIKDDLDILFSELENLENVVIQQFNSITTQTNRINSRIKRLSSRVSDYSLYAQLPLKDSLFFTDSFTDTSKVQTSSPLLNTSECEINQAEGIATLPIDQSKTETLSVVLTPVINSNSNGRTGNNEELNVLQLNNNIQVIVDNNPDTWFEYERVVKTDDGVSLLLDVTVNLGSEQIVNFIRINPNNFGTKTEIQIEEIATSVDGLVYKSIKDEIPVEGFFVKDEENVFTLAPSTSKYAGQGLYTITPRFAKYVKLTLRQVSPYIINTVQGEQFRYAIGIRDIEIKKVAYQSVGELVSTVFQTDSEIKKVALRTNEVPSVASELASVKHQLSFDDGGTWTNVQPLANDSVLNTPVNAAEVINVNTEDENSIKTSTPVKSVRYKAILARDDSAFNESSTTFAEQVGSISELKTIPLSEPWNINLSYNPIVDSISVLDTSFGSRGHSEIRYIVGQGTGNSIRFNLPWDDLYLDQVKTSANLLSLQSIIRVFVGGVEWSQVPSLVGKSPEDKVFCLITNSNNKKSSLKNKKEESTSAAVPGSITLAFGDGSQGFAPEQNALIEILFTDERLYPTGKGSHLSKFKFPTSIDKSTVSIYRRGSVIQNTIELSHQTNIHRLPHRNILIDASHPIRFTNPDSAFNSRVGFSNGLAAPDGELTAAGEWSIDIDRGIIYSFNRTDSTPGTVTYYYQAIETIPTDGWDWGDTLPVHESVVIKNNAWVPNKVGGIAVASGLNKINLPHLSLIEGSLRFDGVSGLTDISNPFNEEVSFIDGVSELTTLIKTKQPVPTLTPIGTVASFSTLLKLSESSLFNVSFSDTSVFVQEVANFAAVNSVGKFWVDRATSVIYVHTDSVPVESPGEIEYYVKDPSKIPTGAYSVNYETGEIFLQRAVPTTGISVSYEYADYFMKYNIARKIEEKNWSLAANKTITINSNETSIRARIPTVAGNNVVKPTTYQVNYKYIASTRKNISDLKQYFTPILKDYVLQVITDEQL